MTLSRTLQASAAAALFFLGSTALAAENSGTTEVSKTAPRTARATGAANGSGQTSGPATGTNVQPTQAPAAAGEPGVPGLPGNKSGPAVMPPKDQQNGQQQQGK